MNSKKDKQIIAYENLEDSGITLRNLIVPMVTDNTPVQDST